jgi:hypothetical protein
MKEINLTHIRMNIEAQKKLKTQRENYQTKKELVEFKREKLLEDPIGDYLLFVIAEVARVMGVTYEKIVGQSRIQQIVQARYFAIDILNRNTKIQTDLMYLFYQDRTTYYNYIDKIDGYKSSYLDAKLYQECVEACTMEKYKEYQKSVNN